MAASSLTFSTHSPKLPKPSKQPSKQPSNQQHSKWDRIWKGNDKPREKVNSRSSEEGKEERVGRQAEKRRRPGVSVVMALARTAKENAAFTCVGGAS
jgi:hypothetical protein